MGGRSAVLRSAAGAEAVVVFEEDDPGLQNESSPTWNAREGRDRTGPSGRGSRLLVSPCPSVVALPADRATSLGTRTACHGQAPLVVVDRRDEDVGRSGLFSPTFVEVARDVLGSGGRVVCVLNRPAVPVRRVPQLRDGHHPASAATPRCT